MKLWRLIDGKKTLAGGAMLLTAALLDQVVLGIWEVVSPMLDKTAHSLEWVGIVVTGGGFAHKAGKRFSG